MRSDFYVYVYFHPVTGLPCYIGKGHGNRWLKHRRHTSNARLRNIIRKYGDVPCLKLRTNLTEAAAFETEIALIKAIGRGSNGPLVNLTDGGDGTTGFFPSAETRAKYSARSRKPENLAILLQRNHSPENIERLRKLAASPERRAKVSMIASSPEHLARLTAMNRSPEQRALKAVLGKRPEVIATLNKNANSPEWRIRRGEMSRTPEHLAKLLEHNRSAEHRLQVAERNKTPEMRARSSAWASSPEFRAKAKAGLQRYHARLAAEKALSENKA
jgi:hypothetical protein